MDFKKGDSTVFNYFQIHFVNKIAKTGFVTKNGKINFCHIMDNKVVMRFFKPLIDDFLKNINFELECPFKKVSIPQVSYD